MLFVLRACKHACIIYNITDSHHVRCFSHFRVYSICMFGIFDLCITLGCYQCVKSMDRNSLNSCTKLVLEAKKIHLTTTIRQLGYNAFVRSAKRRERESGWKTSAMKKKSTSNSLSQHLNTISYFPLRFLLWSKKKEEKKLPECMK